LQPVDTVGVSVSAMKMINPYLTVGAALLALALPTSVFAKAVVGEPAPDFSLTDISGKTYKLSELKGKPVVLEWVNPECPFVARHYNTGNMPGLQKSMTGDGVVWLTINSGSKGAQGDYDPEKVKEWMKKTGATPTAYFRDQDGKVGKLYAAKTTPHMFVISPEGKLVYDGAIDNSPRGGADAENYVKPALTAAKTGGMPAKSKTEPYGCNVKY
jgi:hypothetical protein